MQHDFLALHSPLGANASFALGLKGAGGGFGVEQERVPSQDVFIGMRKGNKITCFPYFKDAVSKQSESFLQTETQNESIINCFPEDKIVREYEYGYDTFSAEELKFEIACPVKGVPDPKNANFEEVKDAIAPALITKFTIDNSKGKEDIEAFFAIAPFMGKIFLSDTTNGKRKGIISRNGYGFAVEDTNEIEIREISDFDFQSHYQRNSEIRLTVASMGGLLFKVPAGKKFTTNMVLGFYKAGEVTYGAMECEYYYTKYFGSIFDVLDYGLAKADTWWNQAKDSTEELNRANLNEHKKFLVVHATRAYNTSTMFFNQGGCPLWVVNEGTFMMLNTLDLSVDHCFYELRYNPWVVRNQLDLCVDKYSYMDQCGLSFTHDCGTHHTFTPFGNSSYEIPGITDCFSYMTQEQLCNWSLMAGMYVEHTKDKAWLNKNIGILSMCLDSMINRTNGNEYGIMKIDSSRCKGGAEITTYDSLDQSLGQARDNLYIVMKCFATYLSLESMFKMAGREDKSELAHSMAIKCSKAVIENVNPNTKIVPAILDGKDNSSIIPVIEPLVYLEYTGNKERLNPHGEFGKLIEVLTDHTKAVLKKGVCLYDDGGFKLSANSDNSWMSKIFICCYTASNILKIELSEESDIAHETWWRVGCKDNPGIDQIISGSSAESRFHYPRSVTSTLWW